MEIDEKTDEMEYTFHKMTVTANSALIIADKYNSLVQEVKEVKKFWKDNPKHYCLMNIMT